MTSGRVIIRDCNLYDNSASTVSCTARLIAREVCHSCAQLFHSSLTLSLLRAYHHHPHLVAKAHPPDANREEALRYLAVWSR